MNNSKIVSYYVENPFYDNYSYGNNTNSNNFKIDLKKGNKYDIEPFNDSNKFNNNSIALFKGAWFLGCTKDTKRYMRESGKLEACNLCYFLIRDRNNNSNKFIMQIDANDIKIAKLLESKTNGGAKKKSQTKKPITKPTKDKKPKKKTTKKDNKKKTCKM